MTDAEAGPGSTVARRQLGRYLRTARMEARLTVKAAATALEWGETKMWKVETGRSNLRTYEVEAMCRIYGVTAELVAVLMDLAKQSKAGSSWQDHAGALPGGFDLYIGLEGAASELHSYESERVPGIFQTADYARAIISDGRHGGDPTTVEQIVALRVARQTLLTRVTAAPRVVVILNEAVLRRPIGGRQVMAAQLTRLVEISELPNVTLQVVPFSFGVHDGLSSGPFVIMRFPQAADGKDIEPPVVYVESFTGSLYFDKPHEVDQFDGAFNGMLRRIDNDTARSTGFLREAAREMSG